MYSYGGSLYNKNGSLKSQLNRKPTIELTSEETYNNSHNERITELELQLELQIQINQKLLEVIKMIEPYFIERYDEINKLIELQNR